MGTLFGFAVGYILGARAGSESFDRVVEAFREVRDSEEFRAFVEVVRAHVKGTATVVAERLAGPEDATEERLDRARERARGP